MSGSLAYSCLLSSSVLSLLMVNQALVIPPSDHHQSASTRDHTHRQLPVVTCPLLTSMEVAMCDQELDAWRDDEDDVNTDDDGGEKDEKRKVTVGTVCVLDASGSDLTVVMCTEQGWTVTTDNDIQHKETKILKRRKTSGIQFVVGLIEAAVKGCVLFCKEINAPPRITCPYIPALIYADKKKNYAAITWDRPPAKDPEEGSLRAWRTSGVGPGVPLTVGAYQVSFMTKDSTGKADTCTKNFQVKVRRCSSSHTYLTNGKASCNSYTVYGSKCDYSCVPGFNLIGSSSSYCQSNGTWSSSKPTCEEISCKKPMDDNHIRLEGNHYLFGATCGVSCKRAGYALQGSPTIRCQASGNWSSPGQCVDLLPPTIHCNQTLITFAGPEGSNTTVNWTLPTATDNSGQIIQVISDPPPGITFDLGSHKVTFTGADTAGNKAKCLMTVSVAVRKCNVNVSTPDFADVTCSDGNVYGSVCRVSCHQGFQLTGDATLKCEEDGLWSGEAPQCRPRSCLAPPFISHGSYVCSNGQKYQDSCSITCDKGYRPVAPLTITCNINIEWSQTGSCLDIQPPVFPDGCPADMVVIAARLGSNTHVTYAFPEITDNSGETVTIEGDPRPGSEFSLGQTKVTVKVSDSQGNTASCQFHVIVRHVSCEEPGLDPQRKLLSYSCPDNYLQGATCLLSCQDGKPVQGPSTITCERVEDTKNFTWTWAGDVTPHCEAEVCPKLQEPTHGELRCTKFKGGQGEQCLITCDDGYMYPKSVPEVYNCFPDLGEWTNDGHVPACIERRKVERAKATPSFYYQAPSCPSNSAELENRFRAALNRSSFLQVCTGSLSCGVDDIDITCTSSRRRKRAESTNKAAELRVSVEIDFGPYKDVGDSDQSKSFYEDLVSHINTALLWDSDSGLFDIPGTGDYESYSYAAPEYACPSGTSFASNTMSCAGCGAGHFFDKATSYCLQCPKGTYQEQEIALSCSPCPSGKSTRNARSTSQQECVDLCQPGTISMSGMQPCHSCPKGSHQSRLGMTSCDLCPFGMSTISLESTSASDCQFYDVRMTKDTAQPRINLTSADSLSFTLSMWVHPVSSIHRSLMTFALDKDPTEADIAYFSLNNIHIYVRSEIPSQDDVIKQWLHLALVYSSGSVRLFVDGNEAGVTRQDLTTDFPSQTFLFTGSEDIKSLLVSGVQMAASNMTVDEIKHLSRSCSKQVDTNILIVDQVDVSLVTPSTCDDTDECVESPCGQHGTCVDESGQFTCVCEQPWSGDTCEIVPDFCTSHDCAQGSSCVNQPEERSYTCACAAGYRGLLCQEIAVNGGWSEWGGWGPCSVTCGLGQSSRSRECDSPPSDPEGEGCHGNGTEYQVCREDICPGDGGWGEWSAWQCSVTCGPGTATRSRQCDNPAPSNGGLPCTGPSHVYKECDDTTCTVDGEFGQWSDWSQCSTTCGGGVSTRMRVCDSPVPSQGGAECDSNLAVESRQCNTHTCPECKELVRGEGHQSIDCIDDDEAAMKICNITCQAGSVLVPDSLNEFQCGRLTNYTWSHQTMDNPTGKLPTCAALKMPSSQKTVLKIEYDQIDCNKPPPAADIKTAINNNLDKTVSCKKSGQCTGDLKIVSTCSKRKRSTGTIIAVIVMNVNQEDSQPRYLDDMAGRERTAQLNGIFLLEEMAMQLTQHAQEIFQVKVGGVDYYGEIKSAQVEMVCQEGSGLMNGACVDCPAGSYSTGNGSCVQCQQGFYQDQPRKSSCLPCPDGLTTAGVGSANETDCEADPPDYMDMFAWSYQQFDYDGPGDEEMKNSTMLDQDVSEQDLLVVVVVASSTIFLALLITVTCCCNLRAIKRESRQQRHREGDQERTYINAAYKSQLSPEMFEHGKDENPYHQYEELPAPDHSLLLDD